MIQIKEIQESFLKNKIKDLELGTRFMNCLPKKYYDYSTLEFLKEFDPADRQLIGCGKKELDLFRLYLEANAVDWNEYKIKKLFRFLSFKKGIFLKNNKLKSEDFNFVYKDLHSKRVKVESVQMSLIF